jgi:hypothetical protein
MPRLWWRGLPLVQTPAAWPPATTSGDVKRASLSHTSAAHAELTRVEVVRRLRDKSGMAGRYPTATLTDRPACRGHLRPSRCVSNQLSCV